MIITKSWSHGDCGRPILTFTFEESDDIAALDYGYPQNVYESYNWFTFPYCNLFLETKKDIISYIMRMMLWLNMRMNQYTLNLVVPVPQ